MRFLCTPRSAAERRGLTRPGVRTAIALILLVAFGGFGLLGGFARPCAAAPSSTANQALDDSRQSVRLGVSADSPTGRYRHSAIVDPIGRRMIMYGGRSNTPLHDLWQTPLDGTAAWSPFPEGATAAPARTGHLAVMDPVRNRMLVFGGEESAGRHNDTWALSLDTNEWSPLMVEGPLPSPRSLHCGVYDPVGDRMIVFGGQADGAHLDDVWALSLLGTPTWSPLSVTGTPPARRREASAIYDSFRNRMIVFGGTSSTILGGVWELGLGDAPAWSRLAPAGEGPSSRYGHSAVYDPTRDLMWVFGGRSATGSLQDLWSFSLSGMQWQQQVANGSAPSPRANHSAVLDAQHDRMIVFAGFNDSLGSIDDTWFLSLAANPTWYPKDFHPAGPTLSPATIEVGQTFTITARVSNAGPSSDDGRIAISFPGMTDPSDAQWVTSTSTGDLPGYLEHPAGSSLTDASCAPVTASYLVVEYADSDWQGLGESNVLSVTVQPQAAGTFYVDVRSTMHKTGMACEFVNVTPSGGVSEVADQQGWLARRYSVTVLDAPDPAFTEVTLSATTITLGEPITITTSVSNTGAATSAGHIAISFPGFTSPSDAQWVSSASSGDSPGYLEHPAGSDLGDPSCQSGTAAYLVAEYVDDAWAGLDAESNTLTLSVQPQATGKFYFYVRSTMKKNGADPCAPINDVPAGGESGFVDQYGHAVKRFTVTVRPTPMPVFAAPVASTAAVIPFGSWFTVTASLRNEGAASSDGRLVVGFPQLTDPADGAWVNGGGGGGDSPGYRELPAGSLIQTVTCQTVTAPYLVVEYADNAWGGYDTGGPQNLEVNTVTLVVIPQAAGDFIIEIRGTMRQGADGCLWVNGLPANGEDGFTDAQGWPVKRFRVQVTVPPLPVPAFTLPVVVSASTITQGDAVTLSARVRNDGADSDHGMINVSFPTLTSGGDAQWVTALSTGDDTPGYQEFPVGSVILDASCDYHTAAYLAVEYADEQWRGAANGRETNELLLEIRPPAPGVFYIHVRSSMHRIGTACDYLTTGPSNGQGGFADQQGFAVKRFAITVVAPPPVVVEPMPVFAGGPSGLPSYLTLGQSLTLTMTVRNDGLATDDGRISVSFPALTSPTDGQWVTSGSSGDTPGYLAHPAGTTLPDAGCQTGTTSYLAVEFADNNWLGLGAEFNTLTLTVVPQSVGPFSIDIRCTMHRLGRPPCDEVNAVPGGGTGINTDQQGWTVRRFTVLVFAIPPPGAPTTTWTQIVPPSGGPEPRHGASFAYDEPRDELFLYGGTGAHYFSDIWSLPLAPGSAWKQTLPGGSRPLQRIMHSMIHNPIEGHFVFFGGYYDGPLADLALLALRPVPWWFSIAPQGPSPSPRVGHTATYDPLRHRMILIGGFDSALHNDVWAYPLPGNGTWTKLEPLGTPIPPRAQHAAVYDPVRDRVLVFGGDGGTFLNDVWELKLGVTPEWNRIVPMDLPPSGRREHTMVYDNDRDRMVVFGGFDGTRRNDLWAFSLADPPRWEQLLSTTTPPAPRIMHGAVYDRRRHRMVVFGGQLGTNSYSDELWSLTDNTLTPALASLVSAETSPDRVRLTWSVAATAPIRAEVHRSAGESEGWARIGEPQSQGDRLVFEDHHITPGSRLGYRLVELEEAGEAVLDEVWVTIPLPAILSLAGATPNPAEHGVTVRFSLPGEGEATLELFDLRGRRVARRDVGELGAGEHQVSLVERSDLPAGVYLVRLTRDRTVLTAKACVVK